MTIDQIAAATTALAAVLALLWWVFDAQRTAREARTLATATGERLDKALGELATTQRTADEAKAGVARIDADRKDALKTWGARMENAESNAEATRLLAVNVQNLSERFSEQMGLVRGEVKELSQDVRGLMSGKVVPARRQRQGD